MTSGLSMAVGLAVAASFVPHLSEVLLALAGVVAVIMIVLTSRQREPGIRGRWFRRGRRPRREGTGRVRADPSAEAGADTPAEPEPATRREPPPGEKIG